MTSVNSSYNAQAPTRSIYVHWPFCPYKCNFCPFVALAGHDQYMERYHRALCQEIRKFGAQLEAPLQIDTLFLGGGTPSTYPPHLLLDMFGTLQEIGMFTPKSEISIEVNPGTVTPEKLAAWQQAGINRLSIGVQSLKDSLLKTLNRHQSAADVYYVLDQARGLFNNVSIDLILGLPSVTNDEWKDLLREVVTWPITHLSIYFLTVHEDTPLYFRVQQKKVSLPYDDDIVDLYYWSRDFLSEHGIYQYEISNFAKPGFASQHNSVYWHHKPYKAFGLGACSFDGTSRYSNEKNIIRYMEKAEANSDTVVFAEELTSDQLRMEKIMLGIRQVQGVAYNDVILNRVAHDKERVDSTIASLIGQGFIEKKEERLVLTARGLSVEHEIATQLSL